MNRTQMESAFNDALDQAIQFHGFAAYRRDYDLFIDTTAVRTPESNPTTCAIGARVCAGGHLVGTIPAVCHSFHGTFQSP